METLVEEEEVDEFEEGDEAHVARDIDGLLHEARNVLGGRKECVECRAEEEECDVDWEEVSFVHAVQEDEAAEPVGSGLDVS